MTRAMIVLVALALSASWSARAQQFDLTTMTCGNYMKGDKDQMKMIAAWLAGYYTDESAPEVVDLPDIQTLQAKLVTFCAREASFPIASAADGILGHENASSTGSTDTPDTPAASQ